jgi:hypothetical protein
VPEDARAASLRGAREPGLERPPLHLVFTTALGAPPVLKVRYLSWLEIVDHLGRQADLAPLPQALERNPCLFARRGGSTS